MKTIIIIGDGMSDWPVASIGDKTPLMVANTPNMDLIAQKGRTGLFRSIPEGLPLGSAVANLSVLGYDPARCFQGRGVLEAASLGICLSPDDLALRCNLVTIQDEKLVDHSAGHIPSDQAALLIDLLDQHFSKHDNGHSVRFYPGISYRHLLVLQGGWASSQIQCAPPHDNIGKIAADLLPRALSEDRLAQQTAKRLIELFDRARPVLESHPVNRKRRDLQELSANAIWPWSPGRKPDMESFQKRFGVNGAVVSAVDLVRGLGVLAGLDSILVAGATGLWDTNYEGKAQACLDALERYDMVYVHVEATDEAGHARDLDLKIRCIEMLDSRLIGPILEGLSQRDMEACISVLPDHPTPVSTGSHAADPVPVAIYHPRVAADTVEKYDEQSVRSGELGTLSGDQFIRLALGC